nr:hypothetical protein [Anaerohalosphaera lusitana]
MFRIQPPRINKVYRVVGGVGVHVHAVGVAYGVRLEESAEFGIVHAGAVVVQAGLGVAASAGVHVGVADLGVGCFVAILRREPLAVRTSAGVDRDAAEGVIGVCLDNLAVRVGDGND